MSFNLLLVVSSKTDLHYSFRAFKAILQVDRAKYGADEDYEIDNVVGNELQQRVDDVVSGAVPQA